MKETIDQRINRVATEFTNGTKHQDSKPLLIAEIEAIVLMAKREVIKTLSK